MTEFHLWLKEPLLENVELINEHRVLVEMFYEEKQTNLILTNEQKEKERVLHNLFKVHNSTTDRLKRGDVISIEDALLEVVADDSQGFYSDGRPKAGYTPLGKIKHAFFSNKEAKLMFILAKGILTVKHTKCPFTQKDLNEI